MNSKSLLLLTALLFLVGCNQQKESTTPGRWYSQSQVSIGKKVFQNNCAVCHGGAAQGTPNWRTPLVDGSYPPPPLNGTAHTWHHPLKMLKRTIQNGSVAIGGSMPAFRDKLSNDEVEAVISFFQSKWSDEVYRVWSKKGL